MLTVKQLASICENPDPVLYDIEGDLGALVPEMRKAGITTKKRVAAFLANVGVETDYLKTLEEYGDKAYWMYLDRHPDGGPGEWRYHGRGYLQVTWSSNYRALGQGLGVDLIANPDLLVTNKSIAAKGAVWYWASRKLGPYADRGDFKNVASIINCGSPGHTADHYSDRLRLYNNALRVLPDGWTLDGNGGKVVGKTRVPGVQEYGAFINWLRPAIGKTPYWIWKSGIIPDGPGAFATNKPVPSIEFVKGEPGIFCAGVANLMLRFVGKRVPTKGNLSLDGGIAAYFSGAFGPGYYSDYDEPFNMAKAKKWADDTGLPVMVGKGYKGPALADQGHVALMLPRYTDGKYYVLQSYGPKWPGLNWDATIEQSHAGGYYEVMVHPDNYFSYAGDEFA